MIARIALLAAITLLALASLRPLTKSVYMPMVDYPQHAYQVLMWYEADHDPEIGAHYRAVLGSSYVATYVLWRGVMELGFPVEEAGRIVIGLGVVGLPLAFLLLLRARRRPPELALLAFPIVYHHALAYGFISFYITTTIFFLAVAAYAAWIARPGWLHGGLVLASGLLVLFGHALLAGLYVITATLMVVLEPQLDLRRRARLLAPLAPTGLLLVAWILWDKSTVPVHGLNSFGLSVAGRVALIPHFLCGGFTWKAQAAARPVIWLAALAGLLGLVGSLAAPAVRTPAGPRGSALRRALDAHDSALMAAGLAALVLYFAVPSNVANVSWVQGRFIVFSFLLLVASFAPIPQVLARAGLAVAVIAVALAAFAELGRGFEMFAREYGDAPALFSSLPRGATVCQPIGFSPLLPGFCYPVNGQLGLYVALCTRGYTPSWVGMPHLILRFRGDEQRLVPDGRLVPGATRRILMIRPTTEALADYVILRSPMVLPTTLPVEGRAATYQFLRGTGHLWLYALAGK